MGVPVAVRPKRTPVTNDTAALYYYGCSAQFTETANTQASHNITGPVGYRFTAPRSGNITGITIYYVLSIPDYSGGTQGISTISLQSDDGTAAHLPTGTVLGSCPTLALSTISQPNGSANVTQTFSASVAVTAGTMYHIVSTNTASSPSTNYYSVDMVSDVQGSDVTAAPPYAYQRGSGQVAGGKVRHPAVGDLEFSHWYKDSGILQNRMGYFATINLLYSDGTSHGCGYVGGYTTDDAVGYGRRADGTNGFGGVFAVRDSARVATALWVCASHLSGSAALVATLIDRVSGSTLATVNNLFTIPIGTSTGSDNIAFYNSQWIQFVFATPIVLNYGGIYEVRFTTTAGTLYWSCTLEPGPRNGYLYGVETTWADGHAIYNTGSGWTVGVDTNKSPQGDIPFFFVASKVPANIQSMVFSPAHHTGNGSVTTSGTVATCTGGQNILSSRYLYNGKFYWEMACASSNMSNVYAGISALTGSYWFASALCNNTALALQWEGTSAIISNNTVRASWPAYTTGQRICFALDMVNNRIWGRVGAAGTWWGTTSGADPTTSSTGLAIPAAVIPSVGVGASVIVPVCIAASMSTSGDTWTIYSTSGVWLGAAPSGFVAP